MLKRSILRKPNEQEINSVSNIRYMQLTVNMRLVPFLALASQP